MKPSLGPHLDRQLTPDVRVRSWMHAAGELPDWPANAHPCVEVAWPEHGTLDYEVGRRSIEVGVGSAIVVPAMHEHKTRISSGVRARSVWLSAALVEEMGALLLLRERPRPRSSEGARLLVGSERIRTLGRLLEEDARRAGAAAFVSAGALAEALAVEVASVESGDAPPSEPTPTPTRRDPRIARAVELIETSYAEPLTVDRLAAEACMSRFHFSRAFREQVGVSPYQLLLSTRICRAAALLRKGRASVTEAALEVGFTDLGRFARHFKKQVGCAPSELRARVFARSASA